MDSLGVGVLELGLGVEGGDGADELRHGVEGGGEVVQHGDHVGGQGGPGGPLLGDGLGLLVAWEVTRQQEPEEALGERLLAVRGARKMRLAVEDRVAAEPDALEEESGAFCLIKRAHFDDSTMHCCFSPTTPFRGNLNLALTKLPAS